MGACLSTCLHNYNEARAARLRSDAIDKQISGDSIKFKRQAKVLVLGTRGSGISTIIKQMKIIHQCGFSKEELASFRPDVYRDVVNSAHAIVTAMRSLGLECEDPINRSNSELISDYSLPPLPATLAPSIMLPPPEIACAIHQLGNDPVISKVLEQSNERHFTDSAPYFMEEVLRIAQPGYLPSEMDVLRVRQKTCGITETRFNMGQLSIHMFDVRGQRSERKKWIHHFENVPSIIFGVALSDYDQVLPEKTNENRMVESLILFKSVVNSRWFPRTSILLFLTKMDVFKAKISKIPLEKYFPEYAGGADVSKAVKYILWRFMQENRQRLSVYPHLIQLTDTGNIRLVFPAVKETILQVALKDSGIL